MNKLKKICVSGKLRFYLTISLILFSGYNHCDAVTPGIKEFEVTQDTVNAKVYNKKPVINRLDAVNVYKLAKSAYLLKSAHMLSLPLYKQVRSKGDLEDFAAEIAEACKQSGLDEALIAAVIMTESGFDPYARSEAGALGLMQLMPSTMLDLKVDNPYDPKANIIAGSNYLKSQLERFVQLDLTLAAYNAGPANVIKYGGVPPFLETQNFIKRVKAHYRRYKERQK